MPDLTHLHPMIVHFPIALLIIGFLSDIAGLIFKKSFFTQAGFYLLILGALGVTAAWFSGQNAGAGISEEGLLKQALETHEGAARLTIWLVMAAAIARVVVVLFKKYTGMLKAGVLLLYFLGVVAIARTGYYGGELVYKHAAGVQFDLGFGLDAVTNE